jgi:hypothetical protein
MLSEFVTTGTRPADSECLAWTTSAVMLDKIVLLIRVFTATFEVLRSMDWDISKGRAFTAR